MKTLEDVGGLLASCHRHMWIVGQARTGRRWNSLVAGPRYKVGSSSLDCHTGIQRYQLGFPWKPSFGFYGDILLERGHISPTTVGSRLSDDVRPCDSRESGQMSDEGVSLQKVPTWGCILQVSTFTLICGCRWKVQGQGAWCNSRVDSAPFLIVLIWKGYGDCAPQLLHWTEWGRPCCSIILLWVAQTLLLSGVLHGAIV